MSKKDKKFKNKNMSKNKKKRSKMISLILKMKKKIRKSNFRKKEISSKKSAKRYLNILFTLINLLRSQWQRCEFSTLSYRYSLTIKSGVSEKVLQFE